MVMESVPSVRADHGRAFWAASCERRSFAAATICIAFVIFCVDFTLPIRLRISLRLAIRGYFLAIRSGLRRTS